MILDLFRLIRFAICLLMPKDKPRKEWTIDDVKRVLAAKAEGFGEILNWGKSIVDLCRLIELEPSLQSRRKMYEQEGGVGSYTGSAEQNIWLHGRVMQRLAEEGFGDE